MFASRLARTVRAGLLVLYVPCASGCQDAGSGRSAATGREDEHEEHVVSVTVWEKGHELFLEYPDPVAGEPVELITHVTDLATGEPRREGPVTFHLVPDQGSAIRHVEPAPAREGIYLPELVFPGAGVYAASVELTTVGGPVTLALPDVTVLAPEHEHDAASHEDEPEGIAYLKEQQWRLGTRTGVVEPRRLTEWVRVPGEVKVLPSRRALVTTPVAGLLEAPAGGSFPELGRPVKAGDLLALVRPPLSELSVRILEARAEATRARLALERERLVLERTEQLHEQRARSDRELEEARFAVRLAEADASAAGEVLEALDSGGVTLSAGGEIELRSPIDGHVHHVDSTRGEYATAGQTLLEVLDPSRVLIEARPRVDQLQRVSDLKSPLFAHLSGSRRSELPLALPDVRLLAPGDTIDPLMRTVSVSYEVWNEGLLLRIGQALDVLLPAGESEGLAVPGSALVDEGGESIVYVQLAGETFERRPVQTGIRSEGYAEIRSGLEPGERVVIEGAYAIRLQSVAGGAPAHHHH